MLLGSRGCRRRRDGRRTVLHFPTWRFLGLRPTSNRSFHHKDKGTGRKEGINDNMIVRNLTRCSAVPRRIICRPRKMPLKRNFSTTSAPTPAQPTAAMLGAFTNELDKIAPKFELHGSQIQVLRSPQQFYETLKVRRKAAATPAKIG